MAVSLAKAELLSVVPPDQPLHRLSLFVDSYVVAYLQFPSVMRQIVVVLSPGYDVVRGFGKDAHPVRIGETLEK